mmetsp:Transcript_23977/g.55350  ORF Transcript_23977/g.55350 Transcript_23977/m.55350 type:complete len:94 (-) Transcript_23977:85-366(-)
MCEKRSVSFGPCEEITFVKGEEDSGDVSEAEEKQEDSWEEAEEDRKTLQAACSQLERRTSRLPYGITATANAEVMLNLALSNSRIGVRRNWQH